MITETALDKDFIKQTQDFRKYVELIKHNFDDFDAKNKEEKRIPYLEQGKKDIFKTFDKYFNNIWGIVINFDKRSYDIHRDYLYQMLESLFGRNIEINRHIYQKPLGYSGDFLMMNYIMDYHEGKYLGHNTYEKLINNYTCNIPISCSNVKRKDFFKRRILEVIDQNDCAKIMSVGCGPLRELIELVKEDKINKPLQFKCVDFEKKALAYIKNELALIENNKKKLLNIEYICKNIIYIVKDKTFKENIGKQDLIYSSGLFDYLGDGMAARLTQELYALLNRNGLLIICNASLTTSSHRAYYEMLGNWVFYHRIQQELLTWVGGIKTASEIKFEEPKGGENYLYISIKHD